MNELKPGPELDALVASKVMGWGVADDGAVIVDGAHLVCPLFSIDIAAAWALVEKFPHKYLFKWNTFNDGKWECRFSDSDDGSKIAYALTAPHAICLAALKAVGEG